MKNYVLHLDSEMNEELLNKIIAWHNDKMPDYTRLQDYYDGFHDILQREKEEGKPNNTIVNAFPSYIVDVTTGYFVGKAIAYSSEDETGLEYISEVLDDNDTSALDNRLCTTCCTKKQAYELHYINENGDHRMALEEPENVVMIYDTKIEPDMLYAIRRVRQDGLGDEQPPERVEVYDKSVIKVYEYKDDTMRFIEEYPHFFNEVPFVEYNPNDNRMGIFEKVMTQIDAYNKAQSDTLNDIEYFADCYMYLVGMTGTTTADILDMKKNKVLLLQEEGEAGFLTKESNDTASENTKNRLIEDIHRLSMVPNISDESFGNTASGVSLKFKLWSLEQLASKLERRFKKAINKRLRLIAWYLQLKKSVSVDVSTIELSFIRNMPRDIKSEAETLAILQGRVSDQTAYGVTAIVDDPMKEIERMDTQKQNNIDLYGLGGLDATEDVVDDVEVIDSDNEQDIEQ